MKENIDPNLTPKTLEGLKESLAYWEERLENDTRSSGPLDHETRRIKWNINDLKKRIENFGGGVGNKVFLIDIDGTVCEDIKNEDSHLYATAKVFPEAREVLNKWYYEGNVITFFTAREEKDREVTETWLKRNDFHFHGLVMDKPRIKDGQIYHWIDNKPTKATTYKGRWTDLIKVNKEIDDFE